MRAPVAVAVASPRRSRSPMTASTPWRPLRAGSSGRSISTAARSPTSTAGLGFAWGLDLHVARERLVWTETTSDVRTAPLGGGSSSIFATTSGMPIGVALDAAGGRAYLAADGVRTTGIDGGPVSLLYAGAPARIAVDRAGGRISWSDQGTDTIRTAPLDGSGPVTTAIARNAYALAYDPATDELFWSEPFAADAIYRAPADGTGPVTEVASDQDYLRRSRSRGRP